MASIARGVTTILLAIVVTRTAGAALPLPNFIKPCARNDPNLNECALQNGKPVIAMLKDGLPKYHVPALDPLLVEEIKINQAENTGVGINLVAKEIRIHGVPEAQLRKISIVTEPPSFKMVLFFPRVELLSKYVVNGKVLILPIQGDGDANITMVNLELGFDFNGDWIKKNDDLKYLKIKDHSITYKMDRNYIKLDNLFNGNKALGDRMNEFLDANWREVTDELGPPIADALALIIKSIIAGIVERVPFDTIFPEKV